MMMITWIRPWHHGLAKLAILAMILAAARRMTSAHDDVRPPGGFQVKNVEGWTILVRSELLGDQAKLGDEVFNELRHQLYQITRHVPPRAVEELRKVRIWVEVAEPHHPCMAYHPDPKWLIQHDMDPAKARCVEIANARNFVEWTQRQPWMVLHELAHAYHHQVLRDGFANPEVKDAYQKAMNTRLYDPVLRYNARMEKAYATTNPQEYFAEASEAYFGTNDFYPFVRPELLKHDPTLFELLGRLWDRPGQPQKR